MSHKVFIGIGSNLNKNDNILSCVNEIQKIFENLCLSPVYETQAMGFEGPNFYNFVCSFTTSKEIYDLKNCLNKIERNHGRNFNETKFSSRTLDIDILYFDNLILHNEKVQIPRKEILEYDFVLKPLYDLDPDFMHPELEKSHKKLFEEGNFKKLILKEINFNFK